MSSQIRTQANTAFSSMIATVDVGLIDVDDELHIAGEEWTLVLAGDPVTSALVALDDEDGDPVEALQAVMTGTVFAAMRDLDQAMDGGLISNLQASPDRLAQALAELLKS